MAWANPENTVWGGPDVVFLFAFFAISILYREAYKSPSRSNLTLVQLLLKGGPCQFFFFRELSGRVLDLRPKGRGFEPHRQHCVVVLEQGAFILA